MFIELHQTKDGLPVSVNSSNIQCFVPGFEGRSFVYLLGKDIWFETTESYDEIKMMLTDRLIAKQNGVDVNANVKR